MVVCSIFKEKEVLRFFDIFFSLIAIIVLLPFMIPIMILLKLTGEHDIFYAQPRIGKGGKVFNILKFATMLKDSPNLPGGLFTQENDPRMLPMGPFLRKTKINELPQLINILIGQMSIIGYRPEVESQFSLYPEENKKILEKTTPGLSGIGSIVFRDEEEIRLKADDEEHNFYHYVISPYKSDLECWYVENKSVGLYFKLIWFTAVAVIAPGKCNWKKLKGIPEVPEKLKEYL